MEYGIKFQTPFLIRPGGAFAGVATFTLNETDLRRLLVLIEREKEIDALKAENEMLSREADRLREVIKKNET